MFDIIKFIKFHIFCVILILSFDIKRETKLETIQDSQNIENIINIKDVLFINGCNSIFLPHPYRYRVLHQIEQLSAGSLQSDEFYFLSFDPDIVRFYRVIIFFRCPWTEKIYQAIKLAKEFNKKVLFDIDDLIIDTKYTDTNTYIKNLSYREKAFYDNGVGRIRKTLEACDGAITTTNTLAEELKNYVPIVFINRNTANEEMWKISENAIKNKVNKTNDKHIIIGYFSGSISHNPDIDMIKEALIKILKEFSYVKILLFGILKYPDFLKEFSDQIINETFIDWKELPKIISNIDINIAPIEKTIFNEAKSENKWVEASLVKVPTIASNVGAFKDVINHNVTGLLCNDINDWYISLKDLINNKELRKIIGENAHNHCKVNYNTINTGIKLANFINKFANKHLGFYLPSLQISGGMYVILKHACFLKDEGWDVDFILPNKINDILEFQNHKFSIIGLDKDIINSHYDVIVATLYSTFFPSLQYYKAKKHLYLVQGYETDFHKYGSYFRDIAEQTYSSLLGVEYITVSKWCENWLYQKYGKKAKYAPNGIDLDNIIPHKRNLNKEKIRILIEGDSDQKYKNIDESFKIVENLDKDKFEIWYLSNKGKPKEWYRIDKFLNQISYEDAIKVYSNCDILLKSSKLESFSYPPLEMIATGGYTIVAPNDGNIEYLINNENCLFYKLGDIEDAIKSIKRLISDEKLQKHLYENGIKTAKKRDWKKHKKKIISLYDD